MPFYVLLLQGEIWNFTWLASKQKWVWTLARKSGSFPPIKSQIQWCRIEYHQNSGIAKKILSYVQTLYLWNVMQSNGFGFFKKMHLSCSRVSDSIFHCFNLSLDTWTWFPPFNKYYIIGKWVVTIWSPTLWLIWLHRSYIHSSFCTFFSNFSHWCLCVCQKWHRPRILSWKCSGWDSGGSHQSDARVSHVTRNGQGYLLRMDHVSSPS